MLVDVQVLRRVRLQFIGFPRISARPSFAPEFGTEVRAFVLDLNCVRCRRSRRFNLAVSYHSCYDAYQYSQLSCTSSQIQFQSFNFVPLGPAMASFWRRPGTKTFQLVHRSQRDPLIYDPDASDRVLKEIDTSQKSKVRVPSMHCGYQHIPYCAHTFCGLGGSYTEL